MGFDEPTIAVIFSFLLYVLGILLPMIPAVLIYRLFPDTKVQVQGPLSNLTMNASGAFAAYVITAVLGFFLIHNIQVQIATMTKPTWTIKAVVELHKSDGSIIAGKEAINLLNSLQFTFVPELNTKLNGHISLRVPVISSEWPLVGFSIPDFGTQIIDMNNTKYVEDAYSKSRDLGQVVITNLVDTPYKLTHPLSPEVDLAKGPPPQPK